MREEEHEEAHRLNAEERREREDERAEDWDSPLVRWVKANPQQAAGQIEALQQAILMWVPTAHYDARPLGHHYNFAECEDIGCRKLRDRLRPRPRIETFVP